MSNADAFTLPPSQVVIVGGRRVYQSEHTAAVVNDFEIDITYNVKGTLTNSLGNAADFSEDQTAPGSRSQSSVAGPFIIALSADRYGIGDEVTFTCTTQVSGGVSAFNRTTNQVTVA